jgi:tungstate transport system ATP-binding protein
VTTKLSLRDVVVRRGEVEILRVPHFDVMDGEVLAIIGPNGAGKSTLLQVLALLERPAEGEVRFDGEPTAGRLLELRRDMAVVFQESLLLDRTVEANASLGLSLRGVSRSERRERVRPWLARFGVEHLSKRSGRHLSGGEAQRVSLARAFVVEPSVILLDEPFSALDQPTRESLSDELTAVLSETGVTAVFVTHERDEAARLAHRVAVMAGGRVRQIGETVDVFSSPADETVATYVGVDTVVSGRVIEAEDGLIVLKVGDAHVEAIAHGFTASEALVCLRPEDIVLSLKEEGGQDSARNRLHGVVSAIKLGGVEVRLEVDCGFPVVARITRRSMEELELAVGTPVTASFKATAVHLIPRGG